MNISIVNSEFRQTLAAQRSLIVTLALVWFGFAFLEVVKAFYFNGAAAPVIRSSLYGLYLYMPWFLFSVAIGVLAWQTREFSITSKPFLQVHFPAIILVVTLHILVLTSAYWVFFPGRVTQVTFGFVFGEQALKWAHFEVVAYAVFLGIWRRRFQEFNPDPTARNQAGEFTVTTDNGVITLCPEEIDWLKADDNYVIIHLGERQIRVRDTLKQMAARLDSENFQQTHRSAIVNMTRVTEIGNSRLTLACGSRVPVSRRRHRYLIDLVKTTRNGSSAEKPR